jgi:hypothetical protein
VFGVHGKHPKTNEGLPFHPKKEIGIQEIRKPPFGLEVSVI